MNYNLLTMSSAWYDLVVIGGGPAGATLACLAKKYNPKRKILLLERARFPRHHVGESLLPEVVPILKEMGVHRKIERAGFPRKVGAVYAWGKDRRPWFADFGQLKIDRRIYRATRLPDDCDFAWQVDRSLYDKILLDHAAERGVEVREGWEALELREESGEIRGLVARDGDGRRSFIAAGFVADCSGQASFLSRYRELRRPIPQLKNVAAYAYFKGGKWKYRIAGRPNATRIFIGSTPNGWFWHIPISREVTSVGLVVPAAHLKKRKITDIRRYFEASLRRCPEIWPLLRAAERVRAPGGGGDFFIQRDWSYRNVNSAGPGWIAAGDSALFVDPILSSGVLVAQLSAQRAAYTLGTFWNSNDARLKSELLRAYGEFYREATSGFLALAAFWYGNDRNANEWWAQARLALRHLLAVRLDDRKAFLLVSAGLAANYEKLQRYRGLLLRPNYPYVHIVSQFLGMRAALESVPAMGLDDIPSLVGRREVRSSWRMDPDKGRMVAGRELRLLPVRARSLTGHALTPRLPLGSVQTAVLERLDGKTSVRELARAAADAGNLPFATAAIAARGFLRELALLGGLKVRAGAAARGR